MKYLFILTLFFSLIPFDGLLGFKVGIPAFGGVLFSLVVYVKYFLTKGEVVWQYIYPLIGLFFLYFIWIFVVVVAGGDVHEFVRGLVNLFGACLICGGVVLSFLCSKKSELLKLVTVVLSILFLGVFFEFLFGIEYLSGIRGYLYRDEYYSALVRDVALWGVVRPLFVFQEPSYLGVYSSIFIFLYVTLKNKSDKWRFGVSLFLSLVFFYLLRSPTMMSVPLFYLSVSLAGYFGRVLSVLFLVLSALFLFAYLASISDELLSLTSEGYSLNARLLTPLLVLLRNMDDIFWFGSGLGVVPEYFLVDIKYLFYLDLESKYLLTNSFIEFFIYHGVVGGFAFIVVWYFAYAKVTGVRFFEFLILILIFWNMVGGVVTVFSVIVIGVLCVARGSSFVCSISKDEEKFK